MYVPSFDHFCIWKANHSLIDCQLSGNRIAEAVGVVVLGTGVSAETFRWVKVYHGLPGLDGWVAAWQDTLHAIAFILRRNRQTAPMGVGSSMLWMLLAGGACMTWLYLQTPRRAHSAKSVAWMHRTCSLGHVWVAFKSREDYRIKGTGAASNVSMYCTVYEYILYTIFIFTIPAEEMLKWDHESAECMAVCSRIPGRHPRSRPPLRKRRRHRSLLALAALLRYHLALGARSLAGEFH